MTSKTVKTSPYTSLALAPITGHPLARFKQMINWLAPKDKEIKRGHGLRWLENQFSFEDESGRRHVMRSYGWFAFARNGAWKTKQITPLYIDYLLVTSIYNRERGFTQRNANEEQAVKMLAQVMVLLRPAIVKRKKVTR